MFSQPGEEKDYQDREVESGWPTSTTLQQLHHPTTFVLVEQPLRAHGRTSWPSDAWHSKPSTVLVEPLQPRSQTSLQLSAPKRLHLPQAGPNPSLQYFGLLLRDMLVWWVYRGKPEVPGVLGAVTKSLAEWGSCRFHWSLTQERLFLLHL